MEPPVRAWAEQYRSFFWKGRGLLVVGDVSAKRPVLLNNPVSVNNAFLEACECPAELGTPCTIDDIEFDCSLCGERDVMHAKDR